MAAAAGVDPDRLVTEAIEAGVAPLAARPLSLKMLLRVFASDNGFPDTLAALYQQALLLMAGEEDPERQRLRTLTDTAAFAVAARIAAATLLSGRDVIGETEAAAAVRDMVGGTEVDRLIGAETEVLVTEAAVREVLGTALFTARADGMGWAHRTFGEYLAAFWLAGDRLDDLQVKDLMLVDDGSVRAIAPPLRNVAGWLLALRPSFQRDLTSTDAIVLVYGDPASVAVEVRRELLPSLVDALDDQQVERRELRMLWRRVGYEGIAADLRDVLTDPRRGEQTRQAAIDAVAELELQDLIDDVIGIAASTQQSLGLRISALVALRDLGDDVPLDRIRPLALEPQIGDDRDDIKGAALELCWPRAITADELFGVLTPKKTDKFGGRYTAFMLDCAKHLKTPEDLLAGIRWGLTFGRVWHDTRDVIVLADQIVAKAWSLAATVESIAAALADLVELVTPDFKPVLTSASLLRKEAPDAMLDDPAANAAILTVLVGRVAQGRFSEKMLERAILRGFANAIDLHGIIKRWASAETPAVKAAWQAAILGLARGDRIDTIFDVKDTYPELYELVAWRYDAISIDSPEAEALRQQHRRDEEELAAARSRVPPVEPDELDRQVEHYLVAFSEGDIDAFWKLLRPISVDDDGAIRDAQIRDDLTDTPGWRRISDDARRSLVDAAEKYLQHGDPEPDEWLGKPVFFYPAHAGLCALRLLFSERRAAFDNLDACLWRRWASVIIGRRRYSAAADESEFAQATIARVQRAAPDVARETVLALLGVQLHASDLDTYRDRLGSLWDDKLSDALFAQLERTDLEQHEVVGVVEALMRRGRGDAFEWAARHVTTAALTGSDEHRALALDMAGALGAHAPQRLWDLVEVIAAEGDQAPRILLARLTDRSDSGWDGVLEPAQLVRLFGLLDRLFPRDLDSAAERSHRITIEQQASFWRSRIVERLAATATLEAVAAIQTLEDLCDDNGWLRRMGHRAREEVRRAMWAPPAPSAIVRMGGADHRRYIADAPALRRLVTDALSVIATEIRGARSRAPFLWNTKPHRLPRDENEISNMLAEWLRAHIDGSKAIINREVQVNARTSQSADRTDILVQATSDEAMPLSVVVEVKGAWNKDLMTALDDQLATRYLKPDLTDQGIYLVFWFSAAGWEDYNEGERTRRSQATRLEAPALASLLKEQAVQVSTARGVSIDALVIDGSVAWPRRRTEPEPSL
jgi:hypothetical protein